MRKRLILAAVCILTLPFWVAPASDGNLKNSAPFATVALAGHTTHGDWCSCGTPGCICDPGEQPGGNMTIAPSSQPNIDSTSDFDFSSGAMMLALAVWVFFRLRA